MKLRLRLPLVGCVKAHCMNEHIVKLTWILQFSSVGLAGLDRGTRHLPSRERHMRKRILIAKIAKK